MNSTRFTLFAAALVVLASVLFSLSPASAQPKKIMLHSDTGKNFLKRNEIQRGDSFLSEIPDGSTVKIIGWASTGTDNKGVKKDSRKNPRLGDERALFGYKVFTRSFPNINFVNDGGRSGGPDDQGVELVWDRVSSVDDVVKAFEDTLDIPSINEIKGKRRFFEVGLTHSPESEIFGVPFIGIIWQRGKFEFGLRGGLLPKPYKNSDQRFFFGEIIAGFDLKKDGDFGVAGKLGGTSITQQNVVDVDELRLYGGIELKSRLIGPAFIKGAYVLGSSRIYRPERKMYGWNHQLDDSYTVTLSAEF